MRFARLCWSMLALVAVGCGGGDDGPTDPPNGNQTLGSITATPATLNLAAGSSGSIAVVALDTENQVITNPGSPTFSSANAAIAEVSGTGSVLGISAGSTQINVSLTRGGITKTTAVTVTVAGTLPTSAAVTAGTSMVRSMRSISGPLIRDR